RVHRGYIEVKLYILSIMAQHILKDNSIILVSAYYLPRPIPPRCHRFNYLALAKGSTIILKYILTAIRQFATFVAQSAKVAQLVEHNLAKVGVASSNLVFRSEGFLNRKPFFMHNDRAPK